MPGQLLLIDVCCPTFLLVMYMQGPSQNAFACVIDQYYLAIIGCPYYASDDAHFPNL
jgi:hypothetical protein